MLTSARRREQRARFGALLGAARAAPDQRNDTNGFSDANVCAAGPFGILEPDVLALLFGRVLCNGHDLPHVAVVKRADRSVPAVHADVRNAACDLHALSRTCKYMHACFGYNHSIVRLETAATACTSLAPTMLGCASKRSLIDTPCYDQFLQEERSRFDVQMLESAVLSMVTHCTAHHCYAMRRAHNLRIGKQVPERLEQDALLRHLLGGQKPLVKVVHTSNKEMWTPASGLSVHDDQPECLVATIENEHIRLTCLRDESPLGICPNTALRRMWKLSVPPPPPSAQPTSSSVPIPSDWRVKCVALSPCRQWIALVRTNHPTPLQDNDEHKMYDQVLTLWNVHRLNEPSWSFRLSATSIQTAWFRQAEVAAQHAEDDQHRANATILCFCATRHIPPPLWSNQLHHRHPNAHSIGITKVYQYCVDDGSLSKLETLPDWHGLVLKPAGQRIDTHDAHITAFELSISDETSLVSTGVPAECRDSFGVCLFGLVDVSTLLKSSESEGLDYRSLAVQQCVVLDLSYQNRHGDSTALLRPTLPMRSLSGHRPPLQHLAQLSPRGDLVVVLKQTAEKTLAYAAFTPLWHYTMYKMHILGRRGDNAEFVPLACLDLNQSVHRFRAERALATSHTSALIPPRPEGCVRIQALPISRAVSPCGRFLVWGFSKGIRILKCDEGHQPHTVPPLHADGGVCVVDLSEIWEARREGAPAGAAGTAALAWIECKADVVPLRMRWTRIGLWVTTRRGPLLLGSTATA
jgi:hypothetical protein